MRRPRPVLLGLAAVTFWPAATAAACASANHRSRFSTGTEHDDLAHWVPEVRIPAWAYCAALAA